MAYWRRDDDDGIAEPRTTTGQHDAAGRLVVQRDPRLQAQTSHPNLTTVYSLSGAVLRVDSVDAGWRLGLSGADGEVQESWDGRGSHWLHDYDPQRRLVTTHEHTANACLRTIERLTYADNAIEFVKRNQCGQLIRHDDTAGTLHLLACDLRGELTVQTRQFLSALQSPDWPLSPIERNARVEQQEGFVTRRHYSPCGEMLAQADAGGHRQTRRFDRNGQLQSVALQIKASTVQHVLLRSLQYDAQGRIELQSNGNGSTTVSQFDPANGLLDRLLTHRTDVRRLQDMSYQYDAGGNILKVQDHTQPVRYFANQRVEACHRYRYDSLSQLISATGREALGQSIRPELPELMPDPADSSRLINYTEHYDYDPGGNLTLLRHESGHPGQTHRRAFEIAQDSNRALARDEALPADFHRSFDRNGNLQTLSPHGQSMLWTARNQLQKITLVSRRGHEDDAHTFFYDAQGQRVRTHQRRLASGILHVREVRYLPGLEIRTLNDSEHLHALTIQAGGVQIRCLHWVTPLPDDVRQDAVRYALTDHLGSSTLELDDRAHIISDEAYYPYGGTARWAARSEVEAGYKTIRYSGKERDPSGLYDYGMRYYAPWLCRWISADPAGDVDGLNLYRMVKNNPLRYVDVLGQMADEPQAPTEPSEEPPISDLIARYLRDHKHPAGSALTNRTTLQKTYDTATNVLSRSGRHLVSGTTAIAMSYMSDYFANTPLDNVISFLVGLGISVAYSKITSILADKQKIGHKAARIRDALAETKERFHDVFPTGIRSPEQMIGRTINDGIDRVRHHVENEVNRGIGIVGDGAAEARRNIGLSIDAASQLAQTGRTAADAISARYNPLAQAMKAAGFSAVEVANALASMQDTSAPAASHHELRQSSTVINIDDFASSPKASRKNVRESAV